jgi:glucose-6-phosphate dehydrogenase assembly protein OpcA
MTTAAVKPEKIMRDLQELWGQLAQDQAESGGVLKACAMTLIVITESDEDADRVRQMLGVLMHVHPGRAIVIRTGHPSNASLDARVFAECWKPFGRNQQICSEGIEITPGTEGWEDLARFIVPLRVPDLPVVLWCRGAVDRNYMYRRRYTPLYGLADKIIFDTRNVADAEAGAEFLRVLRSQGRRVADLHWTRLTGWREVLAHLFDDRAMEPGQVKSARVGYGGGSLTTCALYFAAWLRTSLRGIRVTLEPDAASAGLHSLTLVAADGQLRVSRAPERCLLVEGRGRDYRTALPPVSEESLMVEELRVLGEDPVWERALAA